MPRETKAPPKGGLMPIDPYAEHLLQKKAVANLTNTFMAPWSGSMAEPAATNFRLPCPGDKVQVTGLRSHPELNGAVARVCAKSMDSAGRVTVQLFADEGSDPDITFKPVKVKVGSLKPLPKSASVPTLASLSEPEWPADQGGAQRATTPSQVVRRARGRPATSDEGGPNRFRRMPSGTVMPHSFIEGAMVPKPYARTKFINWIVWSQD
eukprot:TRINITY_DN43429_c0_g1_i1.p1 TRINITY_DN43429_c0_g1~~TRINITY_DN43429_c0_g1_i1.p1  ORF type:complete len:220 (+),score=31.57 TRINITY_DN43429_c0_g1_i1:35-661(+)